MLVGGGAHDMPGAVILAATGASAVHALAGAQLALHSGLPGYWRHLPADIPALLRTLGTG